MQKFKSVCPYKFHRIFKYDEKNIPNLLDNLVFEVFDMTKESFANFLTEKLEIPVDLGFAPTTEDEVMMVLTVCMMQIYKAAAHQNFLKNFRNIRKKTTAT